MSMKPRLNDGPVAVPNLVTQAKRVPENADLPNSNLASCSKNAPAKELKGTEKP